MTAYLQLCRARPRIVLLVALVFSFVLALATYGRLSFSADREALFRVDEQERLQREDFQRRFGDWKDLTVVLDGSTAAIRETSVLELARKLSDLPEFQDVRATLELPGIESEALYFLSPEELRSLDQTLASQGEVLSRLATGGWYSFLALGADLPEGGEEAQRERFSMAWRQAVEGRGRGRLENLFAPIDLPSRVFFTDGPQRHLVYFRSASPLVAAEMVDALGDRLGFAGRIVVLGQPLLRAQEEAETVRDAGLSTVLAVVLVQLLLIHGFRETARPRLAFLSLVFGLLWSVAWAALAVGVLNIITVNFLAITVGLGIDFSIHYLARYSEERMKREALEAMLVTQRTTGREILLGVAATSLAFFALSLTDFQAVRELGIITGVAIWLCFFSVALLLPALLFLYEERCGVVPLRLRTAPVLLATERRLRNYPVPTVVVAGVLLMVLAGFGTRVRFDYNLLNLQSDHFESVRYERESGYCSLSAFLVADSPEHALELKEQLEALHSVRQVGTVASLLPQGLDSKEALVASIVERARRLPQPSFDPDAAPDWRRLRRLTKGWDEDRGRPEWVEVLAGSGPGPVETVWKQMQAHLHSELGSMLTGLRQHRTGLTLEQWQANYPDLLRYTNDDGKTMLRVQSKRSLWDRAALEEFTDEIRSVTDRGMGPPFLIRSSLEQMRQSYFDAVRYAFLAIAGLLLLYFRSGLRTLIALLPKIAGTVGMLGAMGICGVNFNPANCMALPLTLGIGLVFGIHAVHRCLDCPEGLLVEGSTGKSISLAAWTSIASFGTMLVASNPGIFSIGFVMAAGVAANLLATYFLVPPLVVIFRGRLVRC